MFYESLGFGFLYGILFIVIDIHMFKWFECARRLSN